MHALAVDRVVHARDSRRLPASAEAWRGADRLPVAELYDAWSEAFEARGCSIVDEVARSMTLEQLGVFGFAALTAPSALDALRSATRFFQLVTSDGRWRLEESTERVRIVLERKRATNLGRRLSDEASMAQFLTGMREAAGDGPRVTEITLRHRPLAAACFERLSARRPDRGTADAIVFDRASLNTPCKHASLGMHAHFESQADALANHLDATDWITRATHVIRDAIEPDRVNGHLVARALGVSFRTLQRRLGGEGTTYRAVLDAVRCERAEALLRAGHTVDEVAIEVGYAESGAFHRAFRRWRRESPGAFARADRARATG